MTDHDLFQILLTTILGFVGVVSFFLKRLLSQLDGLGKQFQELNLTLNRIDRDLSTDMLLMKQESTILKTRLQDLDPLYEKMRALCSKVDEIGKHGCDRKISCDNKGIGI